MSNQQPLGTVLLESMGVSVATTCLMLLVGVALARGLGRLRRLRHGHRLRGDDNETVELNGAEALNVAETMRLTVAAMQAQDARMASYEESLSNLSQALSVMPPYIAALSVPASRPLMAPGTTTTTAAIHSFSPSVM